ncbi:Ig-like domain-containing protein [Prevotella sp. P6B1]|uniref:Ig-like domain-containing protein n=1 Tax=Prevotella sp. P6B1 TaxID=1410613 RepID=UPI00051C55E7|nr:Ig-like domain-containing protein [Prevotella sp. P6B1]
MKKLLYICTVALAMIGCARMGQPDGGWYDDDPPKVIGCTPADQATNVTAKKITILFDEYIKLTDANNKVIVSPPQLEVPDIKAAGKKIVVELQDSLMANTTYTIDFSDAISDNNEGNPMGSYTYSFSTGERIDTFEVSGYVLDASNLEPIKGIMVGLYADLTDSAFQTKPMLRVSRTDGSGHFVVKGVAPGTYRAYALQDMDGDFRFTQKSEMIAFNKQTFEPSSKPDVRTDTVWRDSLHIDALIQVPYTHFLPDDITLLAFTHVQTDRFLIKTERVEANKFSMYFSYGHPDLPVIKGLNFDSNDAFVIETNEKQDTIHYWLRDTTLINQDTLSMEISYQISDSTGLLVNQTDTIEALAKTPYEKRLKAQAKEIEQWQKEQDKKKKRGMEYDSIWHEKPLEPKYDASPSMDPDKIVRVEMPTPLQRCDTAAVHLYSMIDSVWYESECKMVPIPNQIRRYEILADWRPGIEYSLEVDSAAFEDIYGKVSNAYKLGIKVKSEDEYGTLKLNITGVEDSAMVVQLLNGSDKIVKQTRVKNHVAEFYYLKPDKYYVSAFIDENGNGIWDTGNYAEGRQAEAVYYYPREIECKAKWDVSQSWNVTGTPIYKQKPAKITKQKPDAAKKLKNRNVERARKLGIEYLKDKGINLDNKK